MSGCAGGSRIHRKDVNSTFLFLKENLLELFGFTRFELTGSYSNEDKETFGDLDILCLIDLSETLFRDDEKLMKSCKASLKKDFCRFAESSSICRQFQSEKYRGRKYLNTGELVSILIPIISEENSNKNVQADIIFCFSESELDFKKEFLSFPAEIQGLLLGLTKVSFNEHILDLSDLNLSEPLLERIRSLESEKTIELTLSSSGISLESVKFDGEKNFDEEFLYKTDDLRIFRKLVNWFPTLSFNDMLMWISQNISSVRSLKRIAGMFSAMVTVKYGEEKTEKGYRKQYCLNQVKKLIKND